PAHFPAQDALVCSDTLCTVEEVIGRKPLRDPSQPQCSLRPARAINAERYLRSPEEALALFKDRPDLIENTVRVTDLCDDDVLPQRTRLPQIFDDPPNALRHITFAGAEARHKKVSPRLKKRLDYELDRIARMGFADHFLTAWDFCKWAGGQGYQYSGRGSVVDSAVAYCLGFSRIDAFAHNLHFDRFLTEDGDKRPDIDIDFEAKHRDDVRNYVIRKYGSDRVATVSAIGAFNTRGIVREVGKVLGVEPAVVGFLAKRLHGAISPRTLEESLQSRPELRDSDIDRNRLHWILRLGKMLSDVPRNIRAHSSGVVISDVPLSETVPVQWSGGLQDDGEREENLRIIQWDKRSARHYFDKFDVLCLRGQDVLAGTEDRVRIADIDFRVDALPLDDEETYRAMQSGELIGVPQSASPAMRQAHIRLGTKDIHDASLVQAGIRPGVGGAVKINELIARRRGKPYTFEHPDFEKILGHTYGIVVFQEQIDQLLSVFAGYTAGIAEDIRERINKSKREDYGEVIRDELIERMLKNGYAPEVAQHAFDLITGFKGYGFAQGHALAFAEISIRSIWCQQNHPAEYFAALLDAQPAGYYGPCTLVNEARLRGVKILPVDVNASGERFEVEDVRTEQEPEITVPNGGIRLALTTVRDLSSETRKRILMARFGVRDVSRRAFEDGFLAPAPDRSEAKIPMSEAVRDSPPPSSCPGLPGEEEGGRGMEVHPPAPNHLTPGSLPLGICRVGAWRSRLRPAQRLGRGCPPNQKTLDPRPSSLFPPPPFSSLFDFARRVRPERNELEALILCGAFDSLCPNRRALLWAVPDALRDMRAVDGLLGLEMPEPTLDLTIEDFPNAEKLLHERHYLGLDVHEHLMHFERERVSAKGGVTTDAARRLKVDERAIVVGNPIRLRFPPTPSGKRVVFFDLEDETGLLNVTCFDRVYQRFGHAFVCHPYVTLVGRAQWRDGCTAFLVEQAYPYHPVIETAINGAELPLRPADFLVG
ncbi:MAG TPA: hypothetical protein VNI20_02885, partial [Fimbriimonadaceae bacterium]|nr:hypothetical protein [Fimbriimonadaceae bacterium]